MNATGDTSARADVYSGDTAVSTLSGDHAAKTFLFAIDADSEPDVLSRVANIFNLANTVPLSASLLRASIERTNIVVQIELSSASTAELIRRKLAQLTCTISVEVTVQSVTRNDT